MKTLAYLSFALIFFSCSTEKKNGSTTNSLQKINQKREVSDVEEIIFSVVEKFGESQKGSLLIKKTTSMTIMET